MPICYRNIIQREKRERERKKGSQMPWIDKFVRIACFNFGLTNICINDFISISNR